MAGKTKIETTIAKLYRRNALNLSMFAYVKGSRDTLHTVTVKDAIIMFMNTYGLSPDDYNIDTAAAEYYRMDKELFITNQNKN